MNNKLLDILACPKEGKFQLELYVFEEKEEIVTGILVCPKCLTWYPIREKIPEMLPDKMRDRPSELAFINRWKERVPRKAWNAGKPFILQTKQK